MDKNKIDASETKPINFIWNESSIKVLPLSSVKQVIFIKQYVNTYFAEGDFVDNYFEAEWTLALGITDACTNIPIIEESDNISMDYLISSGLWEQIKIKIPNYNEFIKNLKDVVNRISEQKALEKSLGNVVDKLADQLFIFFDKIGKMDFSEEGIKKLVESLQNETKNFNDKFNMIPNKKEILQ